MQLPSISGRDKLLHFVPPVVLDLLLWSILQRCCDLTEPWLGLFHHEKNQLLNVLPNSKVWSDLWFKRLGNPQALHELLLLWIKFGLKKEMVRDLMNTYEPVLLIIVAFHCIHLKFLPGSVVDSSSIGELWLKKWIEMVNISFSYLLCRPMQKST